MKVGDLVECTMLAGVGHDLGVVIRTGERVTRVHFMNPEEGRANPRWISVEYLKVLS